VGCIAAVITRNGEVAGAMSISGPSSRLFGTHTAKLAAEVVRSAAAVSKRLSER
jgi:DNA-binding IclR family transcriptional regulator